MLPLRLYLSIHGRTEAAVCARNTNVRITTEDALSNDLSPQPDVISQMRQTATTTENVRSRKETEPMFLQSLPPSSQIGPTRAACELSTTRHEYELEERKAPSPMDEQPECEN